MTTKNSITPTRGPWKYYERDGSPTTLSRCGGTVFTPGDIIIAETYTAADAAYIVQAVNAFPQLVAALRSILDVPELLDAAARNSSIFTIYHDAVIALAAAQEPTP